MQARIIKAAITIERMADGEEKTKYLKAYDEMVSIMKAYDRAEYCKTYPGVRAIYEQLGWVVADIKPESRDTSTPDVIDSNATATNSDGESRNEEPGAPADDMSGANWY